MLHLNQYSSRWVQHLKREGLWVAKVLRRWKWTLTALATIIIISYLHQNAKIISNLASRVTISSLYSSICCLQHSRISQYNNNNNSLYSNHNNSQQQTRTHTPASQVILSFHTFTKIVARETLLLLSIPPFHNNNNNNSNRSSHTVSPVCSRGSSSSSATLK